MGFYTFVIFVTVFLMTIMVIHIETVSMLFRDTKKYFIIACALVLVCSVTEWLAVMLDGVSADYIFLHKLAKYVEFTCAPFIAVMFCLILGFKLLGNAKYVVYGLAVVNFVAETISLFNGMIFSINNENVYVRGDLYFIYVVCYIVGIFFFLIEALHYSVMMFSRGIGVIVLTVIMLTSAIVVQTIYSDIRVDWFTVGMVCMILYAYLSDLSMRVDNLTGCYNRACYETDSRRLDYNSVVILCDVDKFKSVNDTYGHKAGDLVLERVGHCLNQEFSRYANCYRVGGDEFAIIVTKRGYRYIINRYRTVEEWIKAQKLKIEIAVIRERQTYDYMPEMSLGFSLYTPGDDIENVERTADESMYLDKQSKE